MSDVAIKTYEDYNQIDEASLGWWIQTYIKAIREENEASWLGRSRSISPHSADEVRQLLKNVLQADLGSSLFLAFQRSERASLPCGYLLATMSDRPGELPARMGCISGVYVEPEFRRMKLAQKLYDKACSWFRRYKVHTIQLYVANENSIALEFWKRNNFLLAEVVLATHLSE